MRYLLLIVCLACLPSLDRYSVEGETDASTDGLPPPARCTEELAVGAGYMEGFESGSAGWVGRGENNTWAWGMPMAEDGLNGAFEGLSAWVTNPTGNHENDENSSLLSPCFDATGTTRDLVFSFAHFYETETCCDEAWLEFSTNGGGSWAKVPSDDSTVGGYDDTTNEWWEGSSMGWRPASFRLPGTAGQSGVRLRFVFSTDGSSVRDGIAVDDVRLQPLTTDLGITSVVDGAICGEGVATIENLGGEPVASFDVVSVVDGVERREQVDTPLRHRESVQLAVGGGNAVRVRIDLAGDEVPANNEASFAYVGVDLRAGETWDFEADEGGWTSGGERSSWQWGQPSGAYIGSAASGTRAWVTNLAGDYNDGETSFLLSPCLDLRALVSDPLLTLRLIYETESCCDEGWFELSVDGAPFEKLGRMGEGESWYNSSSQYWQNSSGAPNDWIQARHRLDGAAGVDRVRLRFVFSSDGSQVRDGFGIDDISITP